MPTNFHRTLRLTDLKFAAGFSLWGFRAVATGHHNCGAVIRGFEDNFGSRAPQVMRVLHDFIQALAKTGSQSGRRVIRLSMPGCLNVTVDEISILSAIYYAQIDESDLVKSHLQWLTGSTNLHLAYHAVMGFACALIEANLLVDELDIQLKSSPQPNLEDLIRRAVNVRTLH